MNSSSIYFTEDKHLNELGIALWVEHITDNVKEKLPEEVADHGEECIQCKEFIVEICQALSKKQSAEETSKIRKLIGNTPLLLKIAAVSLTIIISGALFLYIISQQKISSQDLFAQNFKPYPDVISVKGIEESIDSRQKLLFAAISYYNSLNYDSAGIIFDHLYKEDNSNDTVSFYFANTLLAEGKETEIAIKILTTLSKEENLFTEHSQWYLSLALIKNKESKTAKTYLIKLSNHSRTYHDKAEILLKQLR